MMNETLMSNRRRDTSDFVKLILGARDIFDERRKERQKSAGEHDAEGGRGRKKENPGGNVTTRGSEKARDDAEPACGRCRASTGHFRRTGGRTAEAESLERGRQMQKGIPVNLQESTTADARDEAGKAVGRKAPYA